MEDVAYFQRGTLNLMRHLGMVAGPLNRPEQPVHLVGDGNLDVVTLAPAGGYFRPSVALLDTVQRGEPLGSIFDLFGKTLATITAEADGIVIMLRRLHRVHVGEGLVQVTNTLEDYLLMLHR
jgi:predicted deacylase